jgi:hypothetical protein
MRWKVTQALKLDGMTGGEQAPTEACEPSRCNGYGGAQQVPGRWASAGVDRKRRDEEMVELPECHRAWTGTRNRFLADNNGRPWLIKLC